MSKRTAKEVRKDILKVLSDGKEHTYGDLERKVDTNWQTVRNHCEDLKLFGLVTSSEKGITITKEGREILQRL